jgi:prepilin-type N-terminal cleavage/methylation domain-containing protein
MLAWSSGAHVEGSSAMLQRIREARTNEGGFTLIELLIVIIILGILATIVLFATGTFTSDSTTSACKANARIANIAEAAYSAKHEGATTSNHDDLAPYLEGQVWFAKNGPTGYSGTPAAWQPCS